MAPATAPPRASDKVMHLSIDDVTPRNNRPNKYNKEALHRFAESIRAAGKLIHPIIVNPVEGEQGKYEVMIGGRRLRAFAYLRRKYGDAWAKIPALVWESNGTNDHLIVAENTARLDLSIMEEAKVYAIMRDERGMNSDQIAEVAGRTFNDVENTLRLLTLPEGIRTAIEEGRIGRKTAMRIASITSPTVLAQIEDMAAAGGDLSARELSNKLQLANTLLRDAPFSTTEEFAYDLTPAEEKVILRNPCAVCRFNTKSEVQQTIFSEVHTHEEGLCLNAPCYKERWKVWAEDERNSRRSAGENIIAAKDLPKDETGRVKAVCFSGSYDNWTKPIPDYAQEKMETVVLNFDERVSPFIEPVATLVTDEATIRRMRREVNVGAHEREKPKKRERLMNLVREQMRDHLLAVARDSTSPKYAAVIRAAVWRAATAFMPDGCKQMAKQDLALDNFLAGVFGEAGVQLDTKKGEGASGTVVIPFESWQKHLERGSADRMIQGFTLITMRVFLDAPIANTELLAIATAAGYRFEFTRPMAETLSKAELEKLIKRDKLGITVDSKSDALDALFEGHALKHWQGGRVPAEVLEAFPEMGKPASATQGTKRTVIEKPVERITVFGGKPLQKRSVPISEIKKNGNHLDAKAFVPKSKTLKTIGKLGRKLESKTKQFKRAAGKVLTAKEKQRRKMARG